MNEPIIKVGIDIGGALSKMPREFSGLIRAIEAGGGKAYAITDMPREKALAVLAMNGIALPEVQVVSADYAEHGELCKTAICEALGIDILVDDHPGYVAAGRHVRLLVMPDPFEPYYSPTWRTDGSEGAFGRKRPEWKSEGACLRAPLPPQPPPLDSSLTPSERHAHFRRLYGIMMLGSAAVLFATSAGVVSGILSDFGINLVMLGLSSSLLLVSLLRFIANRAPPDDAAGDDPVCSAGARGCRGIGKQHEAWKRRTEGGS